MILKPDIGVNQFCDKNRIHNTHCFVWIILLINLNENFEMCRSGQFFPVLNATLFITIILSIVRYMSLEDPWLMNKHSLFFTQKSKLHMNLLFKVGCSLSHKTCSFINVCFQYFKFELAADLQLNMDFLTLVSDEWATVLKLPSGMCY